MNKTEQEQRDSFIKICDDNADFIPDEDGYAYF